MLATPAISAPSTAFDPAAAVPEEYDVFCHACGYSLVGLVGDRCPECGRRFDPGELPYARVPWLHRRRIGRVWAYVQTVRQVVRRPQAFAEELCRPVRISAGDAKRFRSTTAVLAATSVAVVVSVAILRNTANWGWRDAVAFGLLLPLGWFATVVFLRLATDMPVFIWKGLPSRPPHELAPLHHYASAPLAYAPLVATVALVLPAMADFVNAPEWFHRLCVAAVGAGVCAWLIVCWRTPLNLMRAATGCDRRRVRLLAAYLPVHVLLMFLVVYMSFVLCIFPIIQLIELLERLG
jgi:hypothetical protein